MNPPPVPAPSRRTPGVRARTLPVMGIPVRFETDAPEVMAAVDDAFGAWRGAAVDDAWAAADAVRVRIRLHPDGADGHAPLHQRWAGDRMRVRAGASRGVADLRRRRAVVRVAPGLVRDRARFREGVLEALTLWMLTALDRQPLHAAALERDGRVLLLAGPSGVGKSTLVYAALRAGLRAGLRVLTEDCAFLQSGALLEGGTGPRVWGMPGRVHLLPDAVRWFPELADAVPVLRANGKTKIAIDLRAAGAAAPPRGVERVGICLLARGVMPAVEMLPPHAIEAGLTAQLEPGFHRFAATIGDPIRRLAARGGWRLTLPASPHAAIPLLHRMFDEL
ncbi:MAG TPA: hypothetical protein VLK84_21110 [Longimicrobium sp.]|nr:hypothetical protein [Longimicrobium sp.]